MHSLIVSIKTSKGKRITRSSKKTIFARGRNLHTHHHSFVPTIFSIDLHAKISNVSMNFAVDHSFLRKGIVDNIYHKDGQTWLY